MATIELHNLTKIYPGNTLAVNQLNLQIADGEFLVMVGPSGCGKSTALRMIAGLEKISGGELYIGDRMVNEDSPQKRNISMVFQNYALYPHMSVRANIEFPLKMRGLSSGEIRQKVDHLARMLSLEELLQRKPKALSGGQRQRVAMARALVRDPVAFLMDEPLSNLDAKLRVQMRAEISALQRQTRTTTVYVTHDQVEAMTMGDRVAVMRGGLLQQVAPPQVLYDHPANTFVAAFMGSPSMNLFSSVIEKEGEGLRIRLPGKTLPIAPALVERYPQIPQRVGEPLIFGFRPEAVRAAGELHPGQEITITPRSVESLGHEKMIYFPFPAEWHRVDVEPRDEDAEGQEMLAVGRLPGEMDLRPREEVRIGLDTGRFYLFDAAGNALG